MSAPFTPRRLRTVRRTVVGGTLVFSLLLLSGFVLGPERPHRPLFELTGNPVFEADRRAEESLPPEDHIVFVFAAGRDRDHRGNVLDIQVFRALLGRRDRLMKDHELQPFFEPRQNPLVGHTTTGPWGLPETVRDIMNHQALTAPWFGPDFEHASQEDLNALLSLLFDYRHAVGPEKELHPFRAYCSRDLKKDDEGRWQATGMVLPVAGDRSRLLEAISTGSMLDLQDFELMVDRYYERPLTDDVDKDVGVWTYAAIDRQIDEQVQKTLPLVGLSFLVMNLLVALFFRNLRDLGVVFFTLLLLILWVKGAQAWLGFPDTQLSSLLPILILALGVDFYIHGMQRWRLMVWTREEAAEGKPVSGLEEAGRTVRSFFPALGLATLTTSIGFGTALFSPVPDLREWGLLAVIAIVSAYFLLGVFAVFLRSCLSLGPRKSHHPIGMAPRRFLDTLAYLFQRRSAVIVGLFTLATAIFLTTGRPTADFDARDYVSEHARFIRGFEMEKLTFPEAGEPNSILIEGEQLARPEVMAELQALIDSLDEVGAAIEEGLPEPTIFDLLHAQSERHSRSPEAGAAFEDADGDGIPDTQTGLVKALSDIAIHGARDHPDPNQSRRVFSAERAAELYQMENGSLRRIRIWHSVPHPDDWAGLRDFRERLKQAAGSLDALPGVDVSITGPSYVRFAYVNALTQSFLRSTWIAIGLCTLALILVLRSLRLGLITVVPVLVVAVWLQAFMVVAGISLNIVTVQVISLAIGLGIDYSIHVTQRMREARRELPDGDPHVWMLRTMRETGLALFGSAGTTLAGFLILLLSPMPLFTMFGTVMSVMIGLSVLTGLVLLPPLLLRLGGFHGAILEEAA